MDLALMGLSQVPFLILSSTMPPFQLLLLSKEKQDFSKIQDCVLSLTSI